MPFRLPNQIASQPTTHDTKTMAKVPLAKVPLAMVMETLNHGVCRYHFQKKEISIGGRHRRCWMMWWLLLRPKRR
jgi:hypothetical protein